MKRIESLNTVSRYYEEMPNGTFYGGEEVPAGTFHGGEEVPAGTFHQG